MVQVEEAKGRVTEYDQQVSKVATLDSMTETNKQEVQTLEKDIEDQVSLGQ